MEDLHVQALSLRKPLGLSIWKYGDVIFGFESTTKDASGSFVIFVQILQSALPCKSIPPAKVGLIREVTMACKLEETANSQPSPGQKGSDFRKDHVVAAHKKR